MNTDSPANAAFYFDADAYTESHGRVGSATGPAGLMGRQVAGKEFLDAYLSHGRWSQLHAVVRSQDRSEPLVRICQEHPSSRRQERKLSIHLEKSFVASPPTGVLHFPCPPDARFVWMRQATGSPFGLCGVTHTLSTVAAVQALCDLLVAPFEECDALICTSRAVADMVRAVTGEYAAYLGERFGGSPRLRPRLEVIPLGVNPDRFRPATSAERAAERNRLGVDEDETVVLCVGRLSHHAKAHPFPVFHTAEQAAQRTGRKLRLVFAGWAAHKAIDQAFREGAARLAPSVRVMFVDGIDPAIRQGVWHAADIFVSLPDNIQETFGLVVVEAMASGLPVVGSDWDGYRDLVAHEETGYLVPTRMVHGATSEATSRLLFGHANYDHFLAECSQATIVDPSAAADSLTRLVADPTVCERFGRAGRERVLRHFTWERVIRAYENVWEEQARQVKVIGGRRFGPALYAAPEVSFASYPTTWLSDDTRLRSTALATDSFIKFLEMPLTNLVSERRCRDPRLIARLLNDSSQSRKLGELVNQLESVGIGHVESRATIAWLLKYGLLDCSETMIPQADA